MLCGDDMMQLPAATTYGKRIPKQKFYDHLPVSPQVKQAFVRQIATIIWRNKLAPSTLNIAPGEQVEELQVFELRLNQPDLDQAVLALIDKGVPYHILFLLMFEDKVQACIAYKEDAKSGSHTFKVNTYYHTPWLPQEDLQLELQGLTMDEVYDGFVRQIAGERLFVCGDASTDGGLSLQVERAAQWEKLQKQIDALQKKVNAEKQFNKRVKLNEMLKQLIGKQNYE